MSSKLHRGRPLWCHTYSEKVFLRFCDILRQGVWTILWCHEKVRYKYCDVTKKRAGKDIVMSQSCSKPFNSNILKCLPQALKYMWNLLRCLLRFPNSWVCDIYATAGYKRLFRDFCNPLHIICLLPRNYYQEMLFVVENNKKHIFQWHPRQ